MAVLTSSGVLDMVLECVGTGMGNNMAGAGDMGFAVLVDMIEDMMLFIEVRSPKNMNKNFLSIHLS